MICLQLQNKHIDLLQQEEKQTVGKNFGNTFKKHVNISCNLCVSCINLFIAKYAVVCPFKDTTKIKKKTKKVKKEPEASASSQSHFNNPNTNGQVTTSTKNQLTTANVPECDDLERSKKIKRIKVVRISV